MNKIIDGKTISLEIKEDLRNEIQYLNIKPTLIVIQVGDNQASNTYINMKKKVANEIGINCKHIKFNSDVSELELITRIEELNNDHSVNGIIVQMPLPNTLDEQKIIDTINPDKDVDGLTTTNIGKLVSNQTGYIPCTPLGIITLLEKHNVDIKGKHIVIVGRSRLVGKPLINLFLNKNATVSICHSKTNNLKEITKLADILIVAVGKKHLINNEMIKTGSIIIDVGINKEENNIYGDVDFNDVVDKVSLITPVPGGVGPMTVVMLLKNTIESYKKNNYN